MRAMQGVSPNLRAALRREIPGLLALVGAVLVYWCLFHGRLEPADWQGFLEYGDYAGVSPDALYVLGHVQAAVEGDYPFIGRIEVSRLGAPYTADWTARPNTSQILLAAAGLVARGVGLPVAQNLLVLFGALLAAASFHLAARALGARREWAMAMALLFAFSHYAIARGFRHLMLTYAWHVPLMLLVIAWLQDERGITFRSPRFAAAALVSIASGLQNVYYAFLFCQLLLLAALFDMRFEARFGLRFALWPRLPGAPLALIGLVCASTLLVVSPALVASLSGDPNPMADTRPIRGLDHYALRPIELLIPRAESPVPGMADLGARYDASGLGSGERISVPLGLVGAGTLLALAAASLFAIARGRRVPRAAWIITWILLYGVPGGLNQLLGLAGVTAIRGTNRYSVVILCVCLLLLAAFASRRLPSRPAWLSPALAATLALVGLLEVWPIRGGPAHQIEIDEVAGSDAAFFAKLEAGLPAGAMLFLLPVRDYPEARNVRDMRDYEHLRPYLHTRSLRFSYGSFRSQTRAEWQRDVEVLPPAEMLRELTRVGMHGIVINQRAYEDGGEALAAALLAAGASIESGDALGHFRFVGIGATEVPRPAPRPVFGAGWYAEERLGTSRWRWCERQGELWLTNRADVPLDFALHFGLGTALDRSVRLVHASRTETFTVSSLENLRVEGLRLRLAPGVNRVLLETDLPATEPSVADTRRLGFRVLDLRYAPIEPSR
jgi:hypothetical protein